MLLVFYFKISEAKKHTQKMIEALLTGCRGAAEIREVADLSGGGSSEGRRERKPSGSVGADAKCVEISAVVCNFDNCWRGERDKVVVVVDVYILTDKCERQQVERRKCWVAVDLKIPSNKYEMVQVEKCQY